MSFRKPVKLNLGILIDKPYPHPSCQDQQGILSLAFAAFDSIYLLFTELTESGYFELAERLLKTSLPVRGKLEATFAAENRNDYRNGLRETEEYLERVRFWLKEVQMRMPYTKCTDESVDRINELINILNYLKGFYGKTTVQSQYITFN